MTTTINEQAGSVGQRWRQRLLEWQRTVQRWWHTQQFRRQPGAKAWLAQQLADLRSPEARRRWQAAAALRGLWLPRNDVDTLRAALADAEPFVRWEASLTIQDIGGQAAISILQQTLASADPLGIATAAESLADLGERTSLPRLVELMQHEDPGVRVSAVAAVGRLATPQDGEAVQGLIAALGDLIPGVRQVAVLALGRIGAPTAAAPLAGCLQRHDEYLLVRRAAAWSLGKLGPDAGAIAALTMALTDRDDQVRQIAAQGLGNIGHADVIAALRPLTQDTSDTGRGTVAAAAIQAIEEIEARRAALQPPTPDVPIDHGEASLDERKRRLGLAVPEAEPAPPLPAAGEAAPPTAASTPPLSPVLVTESVQPANADGPATGASPAPRRPRRARKPQRPATPNVASNEE